MRRAMMVMVSLVLLLSWGKTAAGAILPDLTNWGGDYLLSLVQGKVNGKVTAREISGNPLSGVIYQDLTITDPDGKVVLSVDRFEARLSLASIPTFRLDLGALALENPRVYLDRDKSGQWNVGHLLKAEKPATTRRTPRSHEKNHHLFIPGPGSLQPGGAPGRAVYYRRRPHPPLLRDRPQSQPEPAQPGATAAKSRGQHRQPGNHHAPGPVRTGGRLTYSSGTARIGSLNLKLAGPDVVSLTGEVCRPPDEKDEKAEFTCALTGNLGVIKGDQIHALWPRWPAPWDLAGTMSLSSTPEGGKLDLQGKIGEADYVIKGNLNTRVKPAVFELDLDLKGLTTAQLKEIQDLKTQPVQGLSPVNARLHLQGTGLPWHPESLETRLDLSPFRYRDLKVDKVHLELSGNAGSQKLQASVAGNFGSLDLGASGHLLPVGETGQGLSGNLTVQTKDLQPAMVGVAKLSGSSLTTSFTGKFRLPPNFSLAQLSLAGNLQANGRLNQTPLKGLTASFALEGKKLAISQADVQLAGLTASGRGTLTESGVDVTFNAAVSGSGTLPLPPGAAFASLTAEGAVRGPWKAPQVNLTAQARKVSFQGVSLESANLNGTLAGWPVLIRESAVAGHRAAHPRGHV